jgi:hypothetical protein
MQKKKVFQKNGGDLIPANLKPHPSFRLIISNNHYARAIDSVLDFPIQKTRFNITLESRRNELSRPVPTKLSQQKICKVSIQ